MIYVCKDKKNTNNCLQNQDINWRVRSKPYLHRREDVHHLTRANTSYGLRDGVHATDARGQRSSAWQAGKPAVSRTIAAASTIRSSSVTWVTIPLGWTIAITVPPTYETSSTSKIKEHKRYYVVRTPRIINKFPSHRRFSLEEGIRIRKVDAQRSTTTLVIVQVSNGGLRGFMVYMRKNLG
jgi:hypothetical protein